LSETSSRLIISLETNRTSEIGFHDISIKISLSEFPAVPPHYLLFNVTIAEKTTTDDLEFFEDDPEDPYFNENNKLTIKGGNIFVNTGSGFDSTWNPTCARE
jgi:hypothetical protein